MEWVKNIKIYTGLKSMGKKYANLPKECYLWVKMENKS